MRRGLPVLLLVLLLAPASRGGPDEAPLPRGVKAVWDLGKAHREATATREHICLNGLWRWQPGTASDEVPRSAWGFFKVPGCWPGITDYMQKDCQTLYRHAAWSDARLGDVRTAWQEREIVVPRGWKKRRVVLRCEYLSSHAVVFLDGKRVGSMRYPEGVLDVTAACRPGRTQTLSLFVSALPLEGVLLSFNDTNAAREVEGRVPRRGLLGDVWLVGEPDGPRLEDVRVSTSVRRGEIEFGAAPVGLAARTRYVLKAKVGAKSFTSRGFRASDLESGRISFTARWRPKELWDLDTPQHLHEAVVSLALAGGRVQDEARPVSFGFREFLVSGRDFHLNGSRIHLVAVPFDNAQVGAAWACYDAARESLLRLKSIGVNFVYTHNYGCQPGTHLSFGEVLRAADDVGVLVSLSQPHFGHYDWEAEDAEQTNGYAEHAAFYTRVAGSHPSVVSYGTSHNATGYSEDMNPDLIDGVADPRADWAKRNARRALQAEAIIRRLDPTRVVYHHSSGNLGAMHTSNFYANFTPTQELCDWFEHWGTEGVKPLFLCEYGAPLSWDWSMYRGWYGGKRAFGGARVPWELCIAEWNASFLGDAAYEVGEEVRANVRWEADQFARGRLWHRWDYPHAVGSADLRERDPVYAEVMRDTWRAFRGWGVSAVCPWAHGHYWRPREGIDEGRRAYETDWRKLQRPGFAPDYREDRYRRMDLAFERDDWIDSAAAKALIRGVAPRTAFLAGRRGAFTEKGHVYLPGERIEKQLIVVNDGRRKANFACSWSFARVGPKGDVQRTVEPGEQARVPVAFELPDDVAPGAYELRARVRVEGGALLEDALWIHVLPLPEPVGTAARLAVFDPEGETLKALRSLGLRPRKVEATTNLDAVDVLLVGRHALTVAGRGPDLSRVRDGLKVVVFEQTADVLEKRLGFRVAERGFRRVFPRVHDHPVIDGIGVEHLRDWRGEATLLPPRLAYEKDPRKGPVVRWCGLPVTRAWRCGNRGSVASVAIEKPACGDFLPVLDCGFSLRYSPLLVFREGQGVVVFCQLDVTGRSEEEPVAARIVQNLVAFASAWQPEPRRPVCYAGDEAGREHLERAGFEPRDPADVRSGEDVVLVVGPGGADQLSGRWRGDRVLTVGLDQADVRRLTSVKLDVQAGEHIATCFPPSGRESLLAGVGPADVHVREPRSIPLVTGGATPVGNGVLACSERHGVVFCQLTPWSYAADGPSNAKRTFRRTSVLLARLLANLGAASRTPLLDRVAVPVGDVDRRWLEGHYLDVPEAWDDPYRFFRW